MKEKLLAVWDAHPWALVRIGAATFLLFCILCYNWTHTMALLARYEDIPGVGGLAAFGVDGLVVFASFRLAIARREGERDYWAIIVLAITLAVSAVANLVMGYEVAHPGDRLTTAVQMDLYQGVAWFLSTAMLSFVAFFAADTISKDIELIVTPAAPKAKTPEPRKAAPRSDDAPPSEPTIIDFERWLLEHQGAKPAEAARELGIKPALAVQWAAQLQAEGKLSWNKRDGWHAAAA